MKIFANANDCEYYFLQREGNRNHVCQIAGHVCEIVIWPANTSFGVVCGLVQTVISQIKIQEWFVGIPTHRQITRRDSITRSHLEQLGTQVKGMADAAVGKGALISGRMSFSDTPSHLEVHTSDTMEMTDAIADYDVGAAVKVAIILKGRVQAEFDGIPVDLDAREHPVGYIWAVPHPAKVRRYLHKGCEISKVMISARFDWVLQQLDKSPAHYREIVQSFISGLSVRSWRPSRRVLALADQLIYPHASDPILRKLYEESRGLEILAEALSAMQSDPNIAAPHAQATAPDALDRHHRAQEIRDYILECAPEQQTLPMIAETIGISVASMQRIFKDAYGMTVKDFIRETRLVAARDAMEKDGLTIAQAAWLAGYKSPANFATAFKRVFGITPSEARDR